MGNGPARADMRRRSDVAAGPEKGDTADLHISQGGLTIVSTAYISEFRLKQT